MYTAAFWRAALERAVKTFAQTLAAVLGAGGLGLLTAPWSTALSTAGLAALLSLLTSIGSEPVGQPDSPSVLAPRPAPPVRAQVQQEDGAEAPR
ncbi:holin [Umezawaea beigongshangensis]|uniref:holin n=1 Tax=Umezawaea beigongshangensis TaxID=2780383 RepID=UPI0018F27048|nr:holin [Umezawaea beigongshangensis]